MKVFKLWMVLLLMGITNNAFAQIGLRAGINIATQEDYAIGFTSPILGLTLGLQYKIDLFKSVSIQPEVYFIQKGGKERFSTSEGRVSGAIFINYLEAAFLLRCNIFGIGENGVLYLGITPYYGYAFGGKYKFVDGRNYSFERIDFNTDGVERLDYGFGGEIGVDFEKFSIGLRYNHGNPNIVNEYAQTSIFNRAILVGISYYLR